MENSNSLKDNQVLDVTGTSCPIPLIQLAKTGVGMSPGQILKITGDDPIFEQGVRDYCEVHGLEVMDVKERKDRSLTIHVKF